MKRFEYKIEEFDAGISLNNIDYNAILIRINRLGFEGWELVSTNVNFMAGLPGKIVYTFKREINV